MNSPRIPEVLPLSATFCGIAGLGKESEKRLWDGGVLCWNDAMRGHTLLSTDHSRRLCRKISAIREILNCGDYSSLISAIQGSAQARILLQIRNRLSFIDIETTGLGCNAVITVATVSDWRGLRVFVRGDDLHKLPQWLADSHIFISFGGINFDIPFISREFSLNLPQPHVDLSFWYKRCSLKNVEKQYGIKRRFSEGFTGADAVELWKSYCAGDAEALKKLIQYNIEDVISLEKIISLEYHLGMKGYPLSYPGFPPVQTKQIISPHSGITFTA